MLFLKKNHGFSRRRNLLSRLYSDYSGWLPLIAIFSLGIFGTSIYYKNKAIPLSNEQTSINSAEVDKLTKQLFIEKNLTDNLSDKNIDLEQKLNDALAKTYDKSTDTTLEKLNEELSSLKQVEIKLSDENKELKKQLENKHVQSGSKENKIISELKKTNLQTVQTLTQQLSEKKQLIESLTNKNTDLKGQLKDAHTNIESLKTDKTESITKNSRNKSKDIARVSTPPNQVEHFNKVKIDSPSSDSADDSTQSKINQIMSRNLAEKNKEPELKKTKVQIKKPIDNKERTMRLKKGETLWDLSKRAYGKGSYYKKIIQANPKITDKNFKSLHAGTKILVPFLN